MLNHVAIKIGTPNTFTALAAVNLDSTSYVYECVTTHAEAFNGHFLVVALDGNRVTRAGVWMEEELKSYPAPLTYIY
jgi:hypothetical protein